MIKIVVPISGGKDSQACLKLALESYDKNEVLGLFCDTGWEHPITYQHIEWMRKYYDVDIVKLKSSDVPTQILKLKKFPNSIMRFCTDRLKIQPSKNFYCDLAQKQAHGFEVWMGMRSDESVKRSIRYANKISNEIYPPHEINASFPKKLEKMGVMFRLPILDWSTNEVLQYLNSEQNPLYGHGFDRVGCFPCLASSSHHISNAYEFDEFGQNQKRIVMQLEDEIGKKHEPSQTSQMCMFCHI